MLRFRGSILGTIIFFLILIVGIILPQVYRDLLQSHLSIRRDLEKLQKQLAGKDPGTSSES